MSQSEIAALVLAAGQGTRMKSTRAKVLHEVAGKAMVEHMIDVLRAGGVGRVVVVTGYGGDEVRARLGADVEFVEQAEQKGTGHAVMMAEEVFSEFDGVLIVACGDTPLWRPETFSAALDEMSAPDVGAVILTTELEDAGGYGRIIRDAGGNVTGIVEAKDATSEQLAVREINSGAYCFRARPLFEALASISDDNAQGEYYLTDVIAIMIERGLRVRAYVVADPDEAMGVNTPEQLAEAEAIMQARGSSE